MSRELVQALCAAGFAGLAALGARRFGPRLSREIALAAVRAGLQLAAVGAFVALVFRVPALGVLFVALMVVAAGLTSGGRLAELPHARRRAAVAIAGPALVATGVLLAAGAFSITPRAALPSAGILIGGAMIATTLTGRALLAALRERADEIEARLCLGDGAREATAAIVRAAVRSGVIPVIDQTRSAGLVTLPGTFVGLVLGGASPQEAAATQLVVLAALVAVELASALVICELVLRVAIEPGERVRAPQPPVERA